jgi:hypothetical protein
MRPIRAPADVLAASCGNIDRALGLATAVLKVFDVVHGLEPTLLASDSLAEDVPGLLVVLAQLECMLSLLAGNCGLATQGSQTSSPTLGTRASCPASQSSWAGSRVAPLPPTSTRASFQPPVACSSSRERRQLRRELPSCHPEPALLRTSIHEGILWALASARWGSTCRRHQRTHRCSARSPQPPRLSQPATIVAYGSA